MGGCVPLDKVPLDKVPPDKVPLDKVPPDKVPPDKVPPDKVSPDQASPGGMHWPVCRQTGYSGRDISGGKEVLERNGAGMTAFKMRRNLT